MNDRHEHDAPASSRTALGAVTAPARPPEGPLTTTTPDCPHGLKIAVGSIWECPSKGTDLWACPDEPSRGHTPVLIPAQARPDVPSSVGRLEWIERVARRVRRHEEGHQASDLVFAFALTDGTFDYRTGVQQSHLTVAQIAERAGLGLTTTKAVLRRLKANGLLTEIAGAGLVLAVGTIPLYRLSLPDATPPVGI